MQHADDHFLADVAALGQRDRAILDAGFERNGVVGHVDAEDRIPGLDRAPPRSPRRADDARTSARSARRSRSLFARALNVDDKPGHAELIDTRHRHWLGNHC